jgi:hypothetical protein
MEAIQPSHVNFDNLGCGIVNVHCGLGLVNDHDGFGVAYFHLGFGAIKTHYGALCFPPFLWTLVLSLLHCVGWSCFGS